MKKVIFIVLIYYFCRLVFLFPDLYSREFRMDFFDVGQGDAILIRTPGNKLILIDGGPDYTADQYLAERFVANYCALDALILTHPHKDHLAGLVRVFKHCKVKDIYHNVVHHDSKVYKDWLPDILRVERAPISGIFYPRKFVIDGVEISVLWPTKESLFSSASTTNLNSQSVVLFLKYGDFEALLLADAESNILAKLEDFSFFYEINNRLDVLKVPHQGSKDSLNKSFYEKLQPVVSIISVGGNQYGHPDKEVINFLEEIGSRVYRTDINGTVTIKKGSSSGFKLQAR